MCKSSSTNTVGSSTNTVDMKKNASNHVFLPFLFEIMKTQTTTRQQQDSAPSTCIADDCCATNYDNCAAPEYDAEVREQPPPGQKFYGFDYYGNPIHNEALAHLNVSPRAAPRDAEDYSEFIVMETGEPPVKQGYVAEFNKYLKTVFCCAVDEDDYEDYGMVDEELADDDNDTPAATSTGRLPIAVAAIKERAEEIMKKHMIKERAEEMMKRASLTQEEMMKRASLTQDQLCQTMTKNLGEKNSGPQKTVTKNPGEVNSGSQNLDSPSTESSSDEPSVTPQPPAIVAVSE